jgi:hypothetical protein
MNVLCGASLALALTMAAPPAEQEDLKSTPYYPMKEGAAWNYRAGDSHFTLRVTKHEKIGTTWCARVETFQEGKAEPVGSEDVFVKDDGVYRLASGGKTIDPPVQILKLPPVKNEAWAVDSKVGKDTLKGTFTEREEDLTVGNTPYTTVTVSCQDLDANGAKYSFKTYYAKDVGMVKQEIEAGGLKVTIELEKYEGK